jgi:hypothetical protein
MKWHMKLPSYKDIDKLVAGYLFALAVLFILVIETPFIVRGDTGTFSEELLELLMIAILFLLSGVIYRAYRREMLKKEHAYMEMTKQVGAVNRQIGQVKGLALLVKRVPESKRDLKSLLATIGEKMLDIVPSDWAVIRIIDVKTGRTLSEQCSTRGSVELIKHTISNDDLLSGREQPDLTVVASQHENLYARTYCIVASTEISEEQITLISTLANETVLLYVIYTSIYYHRRS